MERRADERYQVQFEAKVTAAGEGGRSAVGRVLDISNSGISVGLPFQLAVGDVVAMEIADSKLYGHVVYSRLENSLFRTGIEVIQVLLGTTGLANLLQRVLIENMPQVPGLEPTETHFG